MTDYLALAEEAERLARAVHGPGVAACARSRELFPVLAAAVRALVAENARLTGAMEAAERRGAVYALEWAWDELNHYFPFLDREACVKEGMAALYPNETESE